MLANITANACNIKDPVPGSKYAYALLEKLKKIKKNKINFILINFI